MEETENQAKLRRKRFVNAMCSDKYSKEQKQKLSRQYYEKYVGDKEIELDEAAILLENEGTLFE